MERKVSLKDEKILDSWSVLIENAQGKDQEVINNTQAFITESQAPGMGTDSVKVRPSWLKGVLGNERGYLMVTNYGLGDYRMYIGARSYGNNLDVQWYLTCEPGFFKRTLSSMLTQGSDKAISFALDVFQQQDLTAYVTVAHHSLLKAVENLMSSLNQDSSKIDRKSRGFLGIS